MAAPSLVFSYPAEVSPGVSRTPSQDVLYSHSSQTLVNQLNNMKTRHKTLVLVKVLGAGELVRKGRVGISTSVPAAFCVGQPGAGAPAPRSCLLSANNECK